MAIILIILIMCSDSSRHQIASENQIKCQVCSSFGHSAKECLFVKNMPKPQEQTVPKMITYPTNENSSNVHPNGSVGF